MRRRAVSLVLVLILTGCSNSYGEDKKHTVQDCRDGAEAVHAAMLDNGKLADETWALVKTVYHACDTLPGSANDRTQNAVWTSIPPATQTSSPPFTTRTRRGDLQNLRRHGKARGHYHALECDTEEGSP
jgi:hypothetical protein